MLLADEPVASLDSGSTQKVMDQLLALNGDAGMTLVISLHHVSLARRYCKRVIALHRGELVFDGPSAVISPALLHQLCGAAADELLHDESHSSAQPGNHGRRAAACRRAGLQFVLFGKPPPISSRPL